MSNFVRVVAFFVLLLSVTVDAAEPIRLRVLSYNIHHAEGVDRKLDVERIAGVIHSVEPDLVALQEVDKKVKRTQSVDQPRAVKKLGRRSSPLRIRR